MLLVPKRTAAAVTGHCHACPVTKAAMGACPAAIGEPQQAGKTLRTMRRGEWLFREGEIVDGLYVLLAGAVIISRRDANGAHFALSLVMPGTTLGFRDWIDDAPHRVSARCSMDSLICRIPRPTAARALEMNRALEGVFFADLTNQLTAAQDRMLQMACLCVRERMVLFLGGVADHFGEMLDNGAMRIVVPVTRGDMGALTGMTPETVSRCINALRDEHLVHFTRTCAIVPSWKKFADELARLGRSMTKGKYG